MSTDLYFLMVHEPYILNEDAPPINATIVAAESLLLAAGPQPDGGRIFRCLTERNWRTSGSIVPLSDLTFELDGGRLWPQVGDWEAVTESLVALSRQGHLDALRIGLPQIDLLSVVHHAGATVHLHQPGGSSSVLDPGHRHQVLTGLTGHLATFLAQGPLWPGEPLAAVPATPVQMPYHPYRSRNTKK